MSTPTNSGERKLWTALGIYAVLAVLEWLTLEDPKIRLAGLLILALFAVRTVVQHRRQRIEERDGRGPGE